MITSVDQLLGKYKEFPPQNEKARLKTYQENTDLFNGEHAKVFNILNKLYHSSEDEAHKVLMILNWPRRLSTLWADFQFGEKPKIRVPKNQKENQIYVDSLINRLNLWTTCYSAAIDVSRFGVGIIKVFAEPNKPAQIQVVSPKNWFPICNPDGSFKAHALIWQVDQTLRCEIHTSGQIETRTYAYTGSKISSEAYDIQKINTGFDQPLVFPIINGISSDNIFGQDDYKSVDPLIKRLEVTFTRIGHVVDVHSDPAFAIPMEAVKKDPETDEIYMPNGQRFFVLGEEGKEPVYITWDGQLTAAFTLIEKTLDQFYAISETSKTCFDLEKIGTQISGTALRLLLTTPLKKVSRLVMQFDPQLKNVLKAVSNLDKLHQVEDAVVLDNISLTWNDGLPNDFSQDAKDYSMLYSQGLVTRKMVLEKLFDLEGEVLDQTVLELEAKDNRTNNLASPETPVLTLPPVE